VPPRCGAVDEADADAPTRRRGGSTFRRPGTRTVRNAALKERRRTAKVRKGSGEFPNVAGRACDGWQTKNRGTRGERRRADQWCQLALLQPVGS